jgi:hypothetical protein
VVILCALLTGWVVTSRKPEPKVVTTDAPDASPEAEAPDAAKAVDSLCVVARATATAKLEETWRAQGHDGSLPSEIPPAPCFAAADGAWTFEPKEVAFGEESGASIDATVAYVRRSDRATLARSSATYAIGNLGTSHALEALVLFDYDGDGLVELFFKDEWSETAEGQTGVDTHMASVKGGKVTSYAPAEAIAWTGADDVDDDGRPDLLIGHRAEADRDCAGNVPGESLSIFALVAHSLPNGTFSVDDSIAATYAKAQCPQAPAHVVTPKGAAIDCDATARNALCARLWGVKAPAIEAEIKRRTIEWSCDEEADSTKMCRFTDPMITWVKETPALLH